VIVGAKEGKKTFVINYIESDLPASINVDTHDPNRTLVITPKDNGEAVPHCIHIQYYPIMSWIPSMLIGGWLVGKGTAYSINGESMKAGNFSVNDIDSSNGHSWTGGYSSIQNDRCGTAGGTGDLNGDGFMDIAIGCRDGSYAAVVYGGPEGGVFPDGLDFGSITNKTGVVITSGCNCGLGGGYLGYSLTFGHFNNDNISDIAVAASWGYSSNPMRVHIIYGRVGGYADKFIDVRSIPAAMGYTIVSDMVNHDLTTLTAGKFSHDEHGGFSDDIVIGDPAAQSAPYFGRIIVIFGSKTAFAGTTLYIANLTAATGMIIEGDEISGGGGLGINVNLIKTRSTSRKSLVFNQPYYTT
jgi:hypothetical protein